VRKTIAFMHERPLFDEGFLLDLFQRNHSVTVEWYPMLRQLMTWTINPTEERGEDVNKPVVRHNMFSFPISRLRRKSFVHRSHRLLGPWRDVSAGQRRQIGRVILPGRGHDFSRLQLWRAAEPAIRVGDLPEFLKTLRSMRSALIAVGFRMGRRDPEIPRSPSHESDVVYAEIVFKRKRLHVLQQLRQAYQYEFHSGKYTF
jgi:hypothetical protein